MMLGDKSDAKESAPAAEERPTDVGSDEVEAHAAQTLLRIGTTAADVRFEDSMPAVLLGAAGAADDAPALQVT